MKIMKNYYDYHENYLRLQQLSSKDFYYLSVSQNYSGPKMPYIGLILYQKVPDII